jgi:hypothetical protein
MKRTGRDEPIEFVIHISMKQHKDSPCYLKLAKHYFSAQGRDLRSRREFGISVGASGRERGRKVNMVQIVCAHVCKCKNDIC